jgi:hypothetical protein
MRVHFVFAQRFHGAGYAHLNGLFKIFIHCESLLINDYV